MIGMKEPIVIKKPHTNNAMVVLQGQEWYQSLIEDCKAIITEAIFTSRWALVEGYWNLGKRIREENNLKRTDIYGKKILTGLSKSIGIGERDIYRSIQVYDKYPDIQRLPEGKNITWNKLITKYLPAPKEDELEIPLLKGKFNIIYADPPWRYWEGGEKNQSRHYKTMTVEEIRNLSIKDICAENCILFLWVTFPALKEGLQVMEAWGFEYSTGGFVWIKQNKNNDNFFIGCGGWTRANAELCLIGTKGHIERKDATVSQLIVTHREEHSKKPDIVRKKIVQLIGDLPRIELFARTKNDGWETFGNEIND